MIAGGGGGGFHLGGGGGAGGYYLSTEAGNSKILFLANTTYTIVIGHGGDKGTGSSPIAGVNGSDTVIKDSSGADILRVKGGGQGGGTNIYGDHPGSDGGCGGGGLGYNDTTVNNPRVSSGGSAVNVDGKGYGGGTGIQYQNAPNGTRYILGGGGGGIGGAGENADNRQYEPGNGGDALTINLTGTEEAFGGGGGGGSYQNNSTIGLGGGSLVNGSIVRVGGNGGRTTALSGATAATPNTGSGGGSQNNTSDNSYGQRGSGGCVILRYSQKVGLNVYNKTEVANLISNTLSPWTISGTSVYYDDGNVGIGTNNPAYKLDLYDGTAGSSSPFIRLQGGGTVNNSVGIIFNPWYGRSAGPA
eukprot:245031-Hanusia_phi.AAC.1